MAFYINKKLILWAGLASVISATAQAELIPALGDESCDSLLLVSSWARNNVKIYDGCSGNFIRDLDSQNLINGPLGILEAPDGDVLVISETNSRMLKFDLASLSQATVIMGDDPATAEIENNFITNPVGAVIDNRGNIYAASYTQNKVVKINTESWTISDEILPANNGYIQGIDAGMALNGNQLYLPGYDSDNIIKINLTSKSVTQLVASGTAGLNAPRTILLRGQDMLVSAEQSNKVMRFDVSSGQFKSTVFSITGPTGMMKDGDSHFLVNNANSVYRVNNDGSDVQTIVANGAGDLAQATFVYRLMKTETDIDQDGLVNQDEINIYGTDPQNPDTDGDNLSDGDEVLQYQSNPLLVDSDGDGMNDDFEVNYGLLVNQDDANQDLDNDGLSNFDEYSLGTWPNNPDTDGDGVNDGEDSTPLIPNTAPQISGVPPITVDQGDNYQFTPNASYEGDNQRLRFSIANAPSWINFSETDGSLTGTPTNDDVGLSQQIKITLTNGYHLVDLDSFDLEVININDAPILLSEISDQRLPIDSPFSLDVSPFFNDIDRDDSLTFSAQNLPAGLTLSQQGIINGSPTEAADFNVTITAIDQSSASISQQFQMKVEGGSGGGSVGWLGLLVLAQLTRRKTGGFGARGVGVEVG